MLRKKQEIKLLFFLWFISNFFLKKYRSIFKPLEFHKILTNIQAMQSKPITTSEAFHILKQTNHKSSTSPSIINSTLKYLQHFSRIKNENHSKELRIIMNKNKFSDEEIALVGSLLPENVKSMRTLVPTLERVDDAVLQYLISRIREIINS